MCRIVRVQDFGFEFLSMLFFGKKGARRLMDVHNSGEKMSNIKFTVHEPPSWDALPQATLLQKCSNCKETLLNATRLCRPCFQDGQKYEGKRICLHTICIYIYILAMDSNTYH